MAWAFDEEQEVTLLVPEEVEPPRGRWCVYISELTFPAPIPWGTIVAERFDAQGDRVAHIVLDKPPRPWADATLFSYIHDVLCVELKPRTHTTYADALASAMHDIDAKLGGSAH